MIAVARKPPPADPDYAALFDFDEARLAAGSGSAMLDAYLQLPVAQRDANAAAVSILNAEPEAMAEAFARLCALTLARDDKAPAAAQRLPVSQPSLRALRERLWTYCESRWHTGAATAKFKEIIRRDPEIAANGWLDFSRPQGGRTVADEAGTLLLLALQGDEAAPDPAFEALLKASFERLRAQAHAYGPAHLKTASDFAERCIEKLCSRANRHALARSSLSDAPAWLVALADEAAERLLAHWRETLPPPLWRFVALHTRRPGPPSDTAEGLIAEMTDTTPQERGALAEAVWKISRESDRNPPGMPWSLGQILYIRYGFSGQIYSPPADRLWHGLLDKPCAFSPEFASTLLRELHLGWNASANFARSLVNSLPRTPETPCMLEQALQIRKRVGARQGAKLDKQNLIFQEALSAQGAPDSLVDRAATARAAFVQALHTARSEKTKGNAHFGVGSADLPRLFALAVAAAKLGPLPDTFEAAMQELAEDLDPSRGDAAGLDPVSRQLASVGLNSARCAAQVFAPLSAAQREAWLAAEDLARHAPETTPSAKWIAKARTLAQSPEGAIIGDVLRGIAQVPALLLLPEPYESVLGLPFAARRALVWQFACHPGAATANVLGQIAGLALGPVEGRITTEVMGNAALWALAELPDLAGLPALARIAVRTRYPKVRKRIEAMIEDAARKSGRTRAELEEDIAPGHAFDAAGVARFALSGATGAFEIRLDARGKAGIVWRNAAGNESKTPQQMPKPLAAAAVKAARETAREIEQDYGVQARRIEKLYRSTRKVDFARWRAAYAEHPFVGPIARRLIWRAGDVAGLWRDGGFEDLSGARHDIEAAELQLWHPVEAEEREVLAWRERLAGLGIDQPFRQAWREIYRATDAERATGHYSNRFAGHILRQHQVIALARLNDWTCRYRMRQDSSDAPTSVAFPEFGVHAEYWTVGAGGDDPPLAESGAYLYLTTDRVAFNRLTAEGKRGERLAVEEVPPRVFSEILRACDLFVSVASLARDAQWLDRGRDAEPPSQWQEQADAYWRGASQAALVSSAQIRRELLAGLLPALGCGDKLTLDDRHLQVRGVKGEYAIHLGSGAAFHRSGRHICIVPDGTPKSIALPFEGDETLALILSKAVLLLRDDEILDPVILRQL